MQVLRNDDHRRPASLHAVDTSKTRRPGIPQKRDPQPAGEPHWITPAMQQVPPGVIKDARMKWTATFGVGQPPKGVSGAMRRVAYGIPDYRIRRWALLLLADRVDALEWRLAQPGTWATIGLALLAGGTGVGALAAVAMRRPR